MWLFKQCWTQEVHCSLSCANSSCVCVCECVLDEWVKICSPSPVDPPQITQHPANLLNVVHGSQVTFTVAANTDAGTLTYQWQLNGANLAPPPAGVSGVTTDTLTINNVQESNTGVYTCVVSNAPKSTTTSNGAQLTLSEC